MTLATTSIDPRLIGMLGRKLYSSNPLPIVVRELLQNSKDACLRKGVEPEIRIVITQLRDAEDSSERWLVSCDDNGIGMTADEIVNDFLCLGGKKPDGTGQIGGFGIAKAAIMSGADWKVRSLDCYLDKEILENGAVIEKRSMRTGTRITVLITDSVYRSSMLSALQMIYYSDVSVDLTIRSHFPETRMHDPNAGFPADAKRIPFEENDYFDLWGTLQLDLLEEWNFYHLLDTGWTAIRLNGLVQYFAGTRNEHRGNNLVFDIKTDVAPEDSNYPFSMSREELIDDYFQKVQLLRKAHDANVLESTILVVAPEETPVEETIQILKGKLLAGSRSTKYSTHKDKSGSHMGNKTAPTKTVIEEKVRELTIKSEGTEQAIQIMLKRYKPDPEKRAWHAKVLLAWQDVLQIAAEDGEKFGIGITSSVFTEAARGVTEGIIYYIINPDLTIRKEMISWSAEALVLHLWGLACHEVTHRYIDFHNEHFTTTSNNIQRDSTEVILRMLPVIARRLK